MAIGLKKGEITANEMLVNENVKEQQNEPKYVVLLRLYLKGKLFKEGEITCYTQDEVTAALNNLKSKLNTNETYITWGPCMFERKKFKKVKILYKKSK